MNSVDIYVGRRYLFHSGQKGTVRGRAENGWWRVELDNEQEPGFLHLMPARRFSKYLPTARETGPEDAFKTYDRLKADDMTDQTQVTDEMRSVYGDLVRSSDATVKLARSLVDMLKEPATFHAASEALNAFTAIVDVALAHEDLIASES